MEPRETGTAADGPCAICGDVATRARVLAVEGDTALVRSRGVDAKVAIDFVPGVHAGDVVLVHLGVAIARPVEEP